MDPMVDTCISIAPAEKCIMPKKERCHVFKQTELNSKAWVKISWLSNYLALKLNQDLPDHIVFCNHYYHAYYRQMWALIRLKKNPNRTRIRRNLIADVIVGKNLVFLLSSSLHLGFFLKIDINQKLLNIPLEYDFNHYEVQVTNS